MRSVPLTRPVPSQKRLPARNMKGQKGERGDAWSAARGIHSRMTRALSRSPDTRRRLLVLMGGSRDQSEQHVGAPVPADQRMVIVSPTRRILSLLRMMQPSLAINVIHIDFEGHKRPDRNRGCVFADYLLGGSIADRRHQGVANAPPDFRVLATRLVHTLLDAHCRMVARLPHDCAAARTGTPLRRTSVR